jgi:hypothetical protein
MKEKKRLLNRSNPSHGSEAAALPRIGEASPAADVSPGYPGINDSVYVAPPSFETASPCQASSETPRVRTSFIPTASRLGFVG